MKTSNSQNFLIGALITSAVIMATLLVFAWPQQKAEASLISQQADLVMMTITTGNGDDTLHVMDTRTGKMISYAYSVQAGRINAVAAQNFRGGAARP